MATPASALGTGPCTASIGGRDVASITEDAPLVINPAQTVTVEITGESGIGASKAWLTILGVPISASWDAPTGELESTISGSGRLADYTGGIPLGGKYEGGYDLTLQDGGSCTGDIWIEILGDPLANPIGAAGGGLAAAGIVGLLTSAFASSAGSMVRFSSAGFAEASPHQAS